MALDHLPSSHLPAALSSGTSWIFYKRDLERMWFVQLERGNTKALWVSREADLLSLHSLSSLSLRWEGFSSPVQMALEVVQSGALWHCWRLPTDLIRGVCLPPHLGRPWLGCPEGRSSCPLVPHSGWLPFSLASLMRSPSPPMLGCHGNHSPLSVAPLLAAVKVTQLIEGRART